MKRAIAAMGLGATAMLAGCGRGPGATAPAPTDPSGWGGPATIQRVTHPGGGLTVSGSAAPGARIVFLTAAGAAYASSADQTGAFQVALDPSATPQFYRSEIRSGADTVARGSGWLVVLPDGRAVALEPGAASRRLDSPTLLATVDYDGSAALVGGAAAPGVRVQIVLDAITGAAVTDDAGRYVARFSSVAPGRHILTVSAGGQVTAATIYLAGAPAPAAPTVEPAGAGVTVRWPLPGGGGQSTWVPPPGG